MPITRAQVIAPLWWSHQGKNDLFSSFNLPRLFRHFLAFIGRNLCCRMRNSGLSNDAVETIYSFWNSDLCAAQFSSSARSSTRCRRGESHGSRGSGIQKNRIGLDVKPVGCDTNVYCRARASSAPHRLGSAYNGSCAYSVVREEAK